MTKLNSLYKWFSNGVSQTTGRQFSTSQGDRNQLDYLGVANMYDTYQ